MKGSRTPSYQSLPLLPSCKYFPSVSWKIWSDDWSIEIIFTMLESHCWSVVSCVSIKYPHSYPTFLSHTATDSIFHQARFLISDISQILFGNINCQCWRNITADNCSVWWSENIVSVDVSSSAEVDHHPQSCRHISHLFHKSNSWKLVWSNWRKCCY